jgi:hypothetical protein
MRQFIMTVTALTAFGALVASAQADNLQGGPVKSGNQCFKYATGVDKKDERFGSWGSCPEAASTSAATTNANAAATTRRSTRRNRAPSH